MTKINYHRSISALHWLETSGALALGAIFVTAVICASPAQAQTYTVLHKFTGADGGDPLASLIRDSAGNLYGTTAGGGIFNANRNCTFGCGVVFKLDTARTEKVLYSFTGGVHGALPSSGVIRDSAGNFYGTTSLGGASDRGVVFKLDTTGKETVLFNFTGFADGNGPSGLIRDSAGNLYGTTVYGGPPDNGVCGFNGCGVVFKLDTTGAETVLYSFTGFADGGYPNAGVIRDSAGNLYGHAESGGASGRGVVFKLDPTGTYTILYSFTGGADGGYSPYVGGGLIRDSAGNLYGTTGSGGIATGVCSTVSGCGVVFKLDTTGTEAVLYSFTGGADGSLPVSGVIRDSAGNLYGTTLCGGTGTSPYPCPAGAGVVFMLDMAGTERVLHSFTGGRGTRPGAGVIGDSAGNLFGTTTELGASGYGVVFKLKP